MELIKPNTHQKEHSSKGAWDVPVCHNGLLIAVYSGTHETLQPSYEKKWNTHIKKEHSSKGNGTLIFKKEHTHQKKNGTLIKMKWIVGTVDGPPPLHLGSKPPRGRLFGLYLWGRVRFPVCNTQSGLKKTTMEKNMASSFV